MINYKLFPGLSDYDCKGSSTHSVQLELHLEKAK